jgi:hypothetical protein
MVFYIREEIYPVIKNPLHSEEYSIQHYVIKFVSDLRQVGDFLRVLRFPSTNKTERHGITEILLKVALNTKTLTSCNKEKSSSMAISMYIWKFFNGGYTLFI